MQDILNDLIDRTFIHIKPHDTVIALKPRKLTLGITTRTHLNEFAGLIHAHHAIESINDLFIANCLHRRQGISQTLGHKTADLIDKTLLKHQIDAQINAFVEHLAITRQTKP